MVLRSHGVEDLNIVGVRFRDTQTRQPSGLAISRTQSPQFWQPEGLTVLKSNGVMASGHAALWREICISLE